MVSGAFLHSAPYSLRRAGRRRERRRGAHGGLRPRRLALARLPLALQRLGVLILWFLLAVAAQGPLATLAALPAPTLCQGAPGRPHRATRSYAAIAGYCLLRSPPSLAPPGPRVQEGFEGRWRVLEESQKAVEKALRGAGASSAGAGARRCFEISRCPRPPWPSPWKTAPSTFALTTIPGRPFTPTAGPR